MSKSPSNWSEELTRLTLDHCKALLSLPLDKPVAIPMKNWNDTFAVLVRGEKNLVLVDWTSGEKTHFRTVEEMVDAGWVID